MISFSMKDVLFTASLRATSKEESYFSVVGCVELENSDTRKPHQYRGSSTIDRALHAVRTHRRPSVLRDRLNFSH